MSTRITKKELEAKLAEATATIAALKAEKDDLAGHLHSLGEEHTSLRKRHEAAQGRESAQEKSAQRWANATSDLQKLIIKSAEEASVKVADTPEETLSNLVRLVRAEMEKVEEPTSREAIVALARASMKAEPTSESAQEDLARLNNSLRELSVALARSRSIPGAQGVSRLLTQAGAKLGEGVAELKRHAEKRRPN